ncbi:hypothetical protein RJ55_06530 [Drechmeria coniospora]|nr:hypothetical protein RJ55_06530 [Drechmeria coniospora]
MVEGVTGQGGVPRSRRDHRGGRPGEKKQNATWRANAVSVSTRLAPAVTSVLFFLSSVYALPEELDEALESTESTELVRAAFMRSLYAVRTLPARRRRHGGDKLGDTVLQGAGPAAVASLDVEFDALVVTEA